jgi:hypothetical protein
VAPRSGAVVEEACGLHEVENSGAVPLCSGDARDVDDDGAEVRRLQHLQIASADVDEQQVDVAKAERRQQQRQRRALLCCQCVHGRDAGGDVGVPP